MFTLEEGRSGYMRSGDNTRIRFSPIGHRDDLRQQTFDTEFHLPKRDMSVDATSRKPIKLALLMCDTPIPSVREEFGTYLDIFRTQLSLSNPDQSFPFTLDAFDVVGAQEYPDLNAPVSDGDGYRGILISGSGVYRSCPLVANGALNWYTYTAHTAHENVPWINKLVAWVSDTARIHPDIRLIGICFGHQIIARALGGVCERNPAGWEVGVTDIQLTNLGKEVFRTQESNIVRYPHFSRLLIIIFLNN